MTTTSTRPQTAITDRLTQVASALAQSQYELVMLAAELADSAEWILAASPTPTHRLGAIVDIEPCTAREWLRVGTRVRGLPTIARLFADGTLSYSKVRALVAVATPANEAELAALAVDIPAGDLRTALAKWLNETMDTDELAAHQRRRRSVTWRTEADGMVTFTLRLQPQIAAILIASLTTLVMRTRRRPEPSERWPSEAQQYADGLHDLLTAGAGSVSTEVILHVRGDGCTADDGTPIPDTVIAAIAPRSTLRAMIHNADGKPIDVSERHRHPTNRQRLVVKERDGACVDCGRRTLLEFDHVPAYESSGRTVVDELHLRCAPCHHKRHAAAQPHRSGLGQAARVSCRADRSPGQSTWWR